MSAVLVTQKTVLESTGLARTTLWRLRERGAFPAAVDINGHNIMFIRSEVDAWLRQNPPAPRVKRDP